MQLVANLSLVAALAAAALADNCPPIHIFAARGTGIPPGYDLLLPLVNDLLAKYPGATSEAVVYPACGGSASCGGLSYAESAKQGTVNIAQDVNNFNAKCPKTKFVLMGYSQGGHIIDNALCGGDDGASMSPHPNGMISSSAVQMIKAVTFMGDPRFQWGYPYEVGSCRGGGFDARPKEFKCAYGNLIQSYCDAGDPYCCLGHDAATHAAYVTNYGDQAVKFIESKLSA